MWSSVYPPPGLDLCTHPPTSPHTWVSSESGCGSIRKCKAQATSWGGSLAAWTWAHKEGQGGLYSYWKAEPSRCLSGGSQTQLDSRAPSVVLVLGECCQVLGGNPSSLNSRLGFWALLTWAWGTLGARPGRDRLGVQLRSGVLGTWLGCGDPGGRELPFCTGSGAAKGRGGRRLTLALFSFDSSWLGKAGVPEELGEEGGEEIRLSDRSCRARCDGDRSGPCAL